MGVFDDMLKLAAGQGATKQQDRWRLEMDLEKQRRLAEQAKADYEASPVLGYVTPEGFYVGQQPPQEAALTGGVRGVPGVGGIPQVEVSPVEGATPIRLPDIERSTSLGAILRDALTPPQPVEPKVTLPGGHRVVSPSFIGEHPEIKNVATQIPAGPFAGQYVVPPEVFDRYFPSGAGGGGGEAATPIPGEALRRIFGEDTDKIFQKIPGTDTYLVPDKRVPSAALSGYPEEPAVAPPGDVYKTFVGALATVGGKENKYVKYDEQGNPVLKEEPLIPASMMFEIDQNIQGGMSAPEAVAAAAKNTATQYPEAGPLVQAFLANLIGVGDKLKLDETTNDLVWDKKPISPKDAVAKLIGEYGADPYIATSLVEILALPTPAEVLENAKKTLGPEQAKKLEEVMSQYLQQE